MKKQEMQRRRREGLRENERGKQGQGEKVIKEEGTLKQVCQTEKGVGGEGKGDATFSWFCGDWEGPGVGFSLPQEKGSRGGRRSRYHILHGFFGFPLLAVMSNS